MKKLLLTILMVCFIATPLWAADTKLSALTALEVAPAGTDQIYINDGGVSKRITIDYLFDYIEAANLTITGNWVNTANPWAENEIAATVYVEGEEDAIAAAIAEGELADSTVVSDDIKDGEIVNADIAAGAAIVGSKLDLAAPGAIGGTTPAAGSFTTLESSGTATIGTSVLPDESDGAVIGSAAAEWSDIYLADEAVIYLGDDQDVTITHDPDDGIDVAGNVDVTGNATVSGTMDVTGAHTAASYAADPSANPQMLFKDSDDAAGTADIYASSSGGANDVILTIGTEDSSGESSDYMEIDGVSETVDLLKPVVISDSVALPSGTNPTVDAAGEIALDTDEDVLRVYNDSKTKGILLSPPISVTILQPDDADEDDDIPVFCNHSGMSYEILTIYASADADDAAFALVSAPYNDYSDETTIESITVSTDGTGVYTYTIGAGAGTDIDEGTVPTGECILFDPSASDLEWVNVTIIGYFVATVD